MSIPERAVQEEQGGSYVLVVRPDEVVESRRVAVGAVHDGLRQIAEGLAAGERVIVDGVQKARPGQKVVAEQPRSRTHQMARHPIVPRSEAKPSGEPTMNLPATPTPRRPFPA